MKWLKRLFAGDEVAQPVEEGPKHLTIRASALEKSVRKTAVVQQFEPYLPPDGVIPADQRSDALAMDATPYDFVNSAYVNQYFPGYQYLAMLAQLPECRKFSEIVSKDMTRKWVKLRSKSQDENKAERISQLNDALDRFKVRELFRKMAEMDGFYGRGQLYIDVNKPNGGSARDDGNELLTPLVMAPAKIRKGSLNGFIPIEPVWTYPGQFNASEPLQPDFFKPGKWFVLGKTIHASRLLTFVSRPVPDLLKASYNFSGLSMSQMAQPYVNNWLRTRDSVSDLVHSFSISGLSTNLSSVLSGADDAQFIARAQLFNTMRDNRGLMMLDKESEEFFQFNTPLGGIPELQQQAQEQMAAVSNMPLVKLLGITPSGLNASSEGEIQVYYDHIGAMQEALYRDNLTKALHVIELSEFGEIDEDIVFEFETLYGMDDLEKANVRKTNADTDVALVSAGIISPDEARARVAADPESGYDTLEDDLEDEGGRVNMQAQGGDPDKRENDLQVKTRVNDA